MTRWVLLRGLTREAGHWGTFPALLRERTGENVCCVDLPGSGERHRERSPARVDALALDIRRQVLPDAEPTVVLALSLGAMVAVELCRHAGAAPAGCILVNTSAGGGLWFWQRLRPACYPHLVRAAMPWTSALERERRVLAMTSARPRMHDPVPAQWARIAALRPVGAGNAMRQLLAASRFRAGVRPPVPILLLASRGDALVSVDCSRRLAAAWDVPLREHAWSGHDLPLDDPAWVIGEAVAWRRGLAR